MKTFFATAAFLVLMPFISFSQEFTVPALYSFESAEDYALYEQAVIDGVDWLINTPINEHAEKRKEVSTFLMQWLVGTTTVSITVNDIAVPFMGQTPELLIIYIGGWTKYSIQNKDKDPVSCSLAGVEDAISFYKKNRKIIPKEKDVESYIKLQEKGTLREYVAKNMTQ